MAAEPLNQAAAARRARTLARAEQALGELEAEGAAVSFQAVAHRAGVSRQWLYTQPRLENAALKAELAIATADSVTPATPEHVTLPSSPHPGHIRHRLAADVAAAVACY